MAAMIFKLALAAALAVNAAPTEAHLQMPDGLPARIHIELSYGGLGCCRRESYDITIRSDRAVRSGDPVPLEAIRRFVESLRRPPVDAVTADSLGMTQHWLNENPLGRLARYRADIAGYGSYNAKQNALFMQLFTSPANARAWVTKYYAQAFHRTDDYPHALVRLSWSNPNADFVVASDAQTPFMLPWLLGYEKVRTNNPDIGRTFAELLPEKALNRARIAGAPLANEYITSLLYQHDAEFAEIEAESVLKAQLGLIRRTYDVKALALRRFDSIDLDGDLALDAKLHPKGYPANLFVHMSVYMSRGRPHDLAGALHYGLAYADLVGGVPWLSRYLRRHPASTAEIRIVQDMSVTLKVWKDFSQDLFAHGADAALSKIDDMFPEIAFVELSEPREAYSRWFVAPGRRMVLWHYKVRAPLEEQLKNHKRWDFAGHVAVGALFDPEGRLIK